MSAHVEAVVGTARAVLLINAYAGRLKTMDLLPEPAAAEAARQAYADACIYVVAAPNQIWRSHTGTAGQGAFAYVLGTDIDEELGHYAICLDGDGDYVAIPLHLLDALYELTHWPEFDEEP